MATEDGVWYNTDLSDNGSDWIKTPGFPDVRVDMIKLRKHDNRLVAATHGRGLFIGKIPDSFFDPATVTSTEPQLVSNAMIYPNPVVDQLTVSLDNIDNTENLSINLYDLNGKQVRRLFQGRSDLVFKRNFDLRNLSKGTYLMVINEGRKKSTHKIIKE